MRPVAAPDFFVAVIHAGEFDICHSLATAMLY
jgi:hypothetical protein